MKFIITDLTRFGPGNDEVCIAGIDLATKNKCIRPWPYIKKSVITKFNIKPGDIIQGDLTKISVSPPHVEDVSLENLKWVESASSKKFEEVLEETSFPSLSEGFEDTIPLGGKIISPDNIPSRSIVTISVNPKQVEIVLDMYKPKSIRLNLIDKKGISYRYFGITDFGFDNLAKSEKNLPSFVKEINNFICAQKIVYLRIGLSREYKSPDGRNGYWVQTNGIYTFPKYLEKVRTYKKQG